MEKMSRTSLQGGGGKFLDFLRDELIPHIEAKYRTVPFRILVGHSLGGLLALDSLLRRPPIFRRISPSIPAFGGTTRFCSEERRKRSRKPTIFGARFIFPWPITLPATTLIPKRSEQAIRDFAELLGRTFARVPEHAGIFQIRRSRLGASDKPVPRFTFHLRGVQTFAGRFEDAARLAVILPRSPSGSALKCAAESFVNLWPIPPSPTSTQPIKPSTGFKLNVANYPESFNAYGSLAVAYAEKGEKELAIETTKKSWS